SWLPLDPIDRLRRRPGTRLQVGKKRDPLRPFGGLETERCVSDFRRQVPIGKLSPELRLTVLCPIGQDHAQWQRPIAIGYPHLEIHRGCTRGEMMGGDAEYIGMLYIVYRLHPA